MSKRFLFLTAVRIILKNTSSQGTCLHPADIRAESCDHSEPDKCFPLFPRGQSADRRARAVARAEFWAAGERVRVPQAQPVGQEKQKHSQGGF